MARIFITGSTDGLGLFNARTLIGQGHDVVLHARTTERATAVQDLDSAGIAIGDLASDGQTRSIAEQVNAIGRMDASSTTPACTSPAPGSPRPRDIPAPSP